MRPRSGNQSWRDTALLQPELTAPALDCERQRLGPAHTAARRRDRLRHRRLFSLADQRRPTRMGAAGQLLFEASIMTMASVISIRAVARIVGERTRHPAVACGSPLCGPGGG